MYILNPLYLSIALHKNKMNEYFEKGNINVKYDKKVEIRGNIVYFKIENIITNNSTLSNIKYHDTLEFSYDKDSNSINISCLPSYRTKRERVKVFTSDIAKIVLQCVKNEGPISSITFNDDISLFVVDDGVVSNTLSIIETEQFKLFNSIIERINIEQEKLGIPRLEDINLKRERVLSNRRKLLGIDPLDYDNIDEFYNEVNQKSRELFFKYIRNIERHICSCRRNLELKNILETRLKNCNEIIDSNDSQFNKVINSYDGWGYILQFPYWYRLGKYQNICERFNFNFLMIRSGTTNFKEENLRVFVENVNTQYKKEISEISTRLSVTIPASLDVESLHNVINFVKKNGRKVNFICENEEVASLLRKILVRREIDRINSNKFHSCSMNCNRISCEFFISVDPDYYNSFLVELPNNRNLWNKYSYAFNPKYKYQVKNSFGLRYIIDECIDLYLRDYPNASLDADIIIKYVEQYEGSIDGRLFNDTDDRVLALMLLFPLNWREYLPYIYYYVDSIFDKIVVETINLSILGPLMSKDESDNLAKSRNFIKQRLCTYSSDFLIENELAGLTSHIASPDFLAQRKVMLVFKEIFQEEWQEHWMSYNQENGLEIEYYRYILDIYGNDTSLQKENAKRKIKAIPKQKYIEDKICSSRF